MKSPRRSSIVWLQGLTCNGNSQSFLNYPSMDQFDKYFEILHHPQIPSPHSLEAVLNSHQVIDFLILEGALSKNPKLISRFGLDFTTTLDKLASRARHIICAGSCASYGGIFRLQDEAQIFGALYSGTKEGGYWRENPKVINISGCPVHPKWLVETLLRLHKKQKVSLDSLRRPREIYAYLVHHGCLRNEYFEWKVDCKEYGQKEGCLFYEHGCAGPLTHANCNKILWNSVSSKTRVGSACFGCTEFDFPRKALFETQKNMSLPAAPFGVPKRAYYSLAGVAKGFKIERLEKRLINEDN